MNAEFLNYAREMGISPDDLYVMLTEPQERPAAAREDDEIKAHVIKSLGQITGFSTDDLWSLDVDTLLFLVSELSEEKHAAEADATNVENMPTDMYSEIEKKLDTDSFADLARASPAFRKWVVERKIWNSRTARVTKNEFVAYPHENPYWSLRAYELSQIKRSFDGNPISDNNLLGHDRVTYQFSHEFSPKNTITVGTFKFLPHQHSDVSRPGAVLNFETIDAIDAVSGPDAIRSNLERKIVRAGYELSRRSELESYFPIASSYDNHGRYRPNSEGDRDLISLIQVVIYAVYSEGYRFKEILTERTSGFDTKSLKISAPLVASGDATKRVESNGVDYYETTRHSDGSIDESSAPSIRNSVIILLDKEGRFIMVQRRGRMGDKEPWMFPGGVIDRDETPWQTAVREWREETEQPFPAIYDTLFYIDYGRGSPHTRIFVAAVRKGQPYTGDTLTNRETQRVELFTLKDGGYPRDMVGYVRRSFKFIMPALSEIESYFEDLNRKFKFTPIDTPVDLVYDGEF